MFVIFCQYLDTSGRITSIYGPYDSYDSAYVAIGLIKHIYTNHYIGIRELKTT